MVTQNALYCGTTTLFGTIVAYPVVGCDVRIMHQARPVRWRQRRARWSSGQVMAFGIGNRDCRLGLNMSVILCLLMAVSALTY